jgi:hypothetical protein
LLGRRPCFEARPLLAKTPPKKPSGIETDKPVPIFAVVCAGISSGESKFANRSYPAAYSLPLDGIMAVSFSFFIFTFKEILLLRHRGIQIQRPDLFFSSMFSIQVLAHYFLGLKNFLQINLIPADEYA